MCGIAGVIDKKNKVVPKLLEDMIGVLIHRGPDAKGYWISKNNNIGFAHSRLSVIDLSKEANQPMLSSDGRYILVYNGEVYNYKNLRKQLEEAGTIFHTSSDTEVVLKGLIHWGKDALAQFHGPFAFAFCDILSNKLLIARDRMGEKPLYFFYDSPIFSFASEIKAIEKLPKFKKELNNEAIVDYLTFGFIPAPKSIWKNVYKLEPGKYIEIDFKNTLVMNGPHTYWELNISPDPRINLEEAAERFRQLLKEVTKEMLVSDVPLGVFLSGGVDSSGVVAALGQQGISVDTFTIGFNEDKFNELPYARWVSQLYNTTHNEKILSPDDIVSAFNFLVDSFDEPFNDFSYLPTYYVTKEARKKVIVCLSGDGADEVFCGYPKYPKTKKLETYTKIVPGFIRNGIAQTISSILPNYSDYKRQIDRTGYKEETFLFDMLAIAFKPKELLKIAGPFLKNIMKDYTPTLVIQEKLKTISQMNLDLVNKLRYLDIKVTLSEDMLVKVDRVSMLNSLEVRPVFLHPKIIDFALKLPTNLLVKREQGKFFLKNALEKWLPKDILYRRKMGFSVPLTKWFFDDLKEVMEDGLKNLPGDWFNKSEVEILLKNHLKGNRDFIMQIHCLVFLGKWLKRKNVIN